MVGLLSSAVMRWIILGGGVLIVSMAFLQSAKNKGINIADAAWSRVLSAKQKEDRSANHMVNMRTVDESASLSDQERQIREKWLTMGRSAPKAKEGQ